MGGLGIPILLIAAILQSTLVPQISVNGIGPDLVFLLIVVWALRVHPDEGLLWAFLGGLLQDLLSALPLGTSALAMLPVALLVGAVQSYNLGVIAPVLGSFGGTFIFHVLTLGAMTASGFSVAWVDSLRYITLPTAIYNTVLSLPLYGLVGLLMWRRRGKTTHQDALSGRYLRRGERKR